MYSNRPTWDSLQYDELGNEDGQGIIEDSERLVVLDEKRESTKLNRYTIPLNCRLVRITVPSKKENFERLQNNIFMITDENCLKGKPQDTAVGGSRRRR